MLECSKCGARTESVEAFANPWNHRPENGDNDTIEVQEL